MRGLSEVEVESRCRNAVTCAGAAQITLGQANTFTFDAILPEGMTQQEIYQGHFSSLVEGYGSTCLRCLLHGSSYIAWTDCCVRDRLFEGMNGCILAYGQTGAGKTYTMGTGFDVDLPLECQGTLCLRHARTHSHTCMYGQASSLVQSVRCLTASAPD